MTDRTCTFEGCGRPLQACGLCSGHYRQRWLGRELTPLRYRAKPGSLMAWLREAVLRETDNCIEWPFAINRKGYGSVKVDGRIRRAHVVALEMTQPWHPPYGPYGLHSCDNPACVNPAHLSWGTIAENNRQMFERGRAAYTDKCKRGHEWTPESTIIRATGRTCRICRHQRDREYRNRARLANTT